MQNKKFKSVLNKLSSKRVLDVDAQRRLKGGDDPPPIEEKVKSPTNN